MRVTGNTRYGQGNKEVSALRSNALRLSVRWYRIMAYVTGVVLIVLCFVGIPLQVFANNLVVVKYVGTTHGILYIIYLLVAFTMTRLVGMKLASPGTVIVLAAGTIPVLTFVVERWVTRRYINPALAADAARSAVGGGAGQDLGGGAAQPAKAPASGTPRSQRRPG
jgi:integral membrane protein